MNDTTVRLAESERLEAGRSGFSRWAPLVFFAFILIGPIFSPDADPQDWVFAVGVVAVALPTFVASQLRGWAVGGAAVLMLLALATPPSTRRQSWRCPSTPPLSLPGQPVRRRSDSDCR